MSFKAIVAPLDEAHEIKVRVLWDALRKDGVDLPEASIPHIAFHVSPDYEDAALDQIVDGLAAHNRVLRIRTLGLGVFPGPEPVGYVPVVRSPELSDFQVAVWSAAAVACETPIEFFHPSRWIPHVTLVPHLAEATRARAIERLLAEDLNWEFEVTELAIMSATEDHEHGFIDRFALQGTARNF
ncbi:MAG: hypothetical protein QOG54_93 [Actinomycetota bacterium]|nr:hypothetical protein [Actinomycetota bacterium]